MKMTGYILNVWDCNNHEEDYTKEVFLDRESAIKGAVRLAAKIVEDNEYEPYDIEVCPNDEEDVVTASPSIPSDCLEDGRSYYRISLKEVTVWSKD